MAISPTEPATTPPAKRPLQFRLSQLLLAIAVCCVVLGIAVPLFRMVRHDARKIQSSNQLKQIALALHNYHDVQGSFPSAYIEDSSGRLHSWRLLITPFLESTPLLFILRFRKTLERAG